MTHKGTVTLETEKLILRRFIISDLEPMFYNVWSNYNVLKWTNYEPMNSIEDVLYPNKIFTEKWFAKYDNLDYYNWAIQLKSTNGLIGRVRGGWLNKMDERIGQIELAYELGENWWGQGIMTEAVKRVIDFFFTEIGYNRVYAGHASENPASGRVMKKCGMTYEGTLRQGCIQQGRLYDEMRYAILVEDCCNTYPL
ncbi:MAG: GNAT family N-acetyltransferase [Defluviitaleaceae bacterium]|nr:GNAT family N-acetyltransferase [Defluviitaleaceae bacterium]MCL2239293.1 GNAT family N-acetyltransferase [Defluviitaleaceae bacterium]